MDTMQRLRLSRRLLATALQPSQNKFYCPAATENLSRFKLLRSSIRYASTTAPPKTVVLEPPDKFRPPSHPQRLGRRAPRQYPGAPLSEAERESQKTKRYPHMFPNEGTFLHWFLTNRALHLIITVGTLSLLAFISLTQSFLHTSPFAHLIPPVSSLPFHPIRYFSEVASVLRMHLDYNTEITAEKRRNQVLDAQKQRLYRRAHGIENLDAEEEQGVDVRGLVPWDDGLTKKERAAGGRSSELTTKMIQEVKTKDADGNMVYVRDIVNKEFVRDEKGRVVHVPPVDEMVMGEDGELRPKKRRVKRWFGIWE